MFSPHSELFLQIAYLESRAFAQMGQDAMVHSYTNRVVKHLPSASREFPPSRSFIPTYTRGYLEGHTCTHGPLECDCEVATHAYFGMDSGSFTPEAIATLLSRSQTGEGFAIFPRISNISGNVGKTLSYYFPERGVIAFKYNDMPEQRVLDPMFIHGGYRADSFVLHGEPIESTIDLTLYKISYYAPADPEHNIKPMDETWVSLEDVGNTGTYSMPSAASANGSTTAFDWATFGIRQIHVYSNYAVFSTAKNKTIVFSREIAWKGARFYTSRPRNGVLLNQVTRWVTGEYSRLTNLPEHLKYSAQLATVVFIMSHCVPDEASSLGELIRNSQAAWDVHAETLAFRPPIDLTPQKIVGGIVYLGLSSYTLHAVGAQTLTAAASGNFAHATALPFVVHHATVVKALAATTAVTGGFHLPLVVPIWMLVTSAGAMYSWYSRHAPPGAGPELMSWAATGPDEQPPTLPTGVYHVPFTLKFGATSRVKTTAPEQQLGSKVVMPATAQFPPKEPTLKVSLLGIGFCEIPRYFEQTPENQATALMNRLTIATPEPVKGLWNAVAIEFLKVPSEQELSLKFIEPDHEFFLTKEVVSRYAAKFPPSRRAELLSAYDDWKRDGGKFKSTDFIASSFVKGELHVKPDFVTPDSAGAEPLIATPRAIIMFKPVLNATLGPVMAHFAAHERTHRLGLLNDGFCPFLPDGISGEDIGHWATTWVNYFGGEEAVITIWLDSVKFDAHNSKDSLEAGRKMTVKRLKLRQPKILEAFTAQGHIRGRSLGGVRFNADFKRCSGSSDTSGGNTKETEAKACFQIEPMEHDARGYHFNFANVGVNYAVAARGDDGYIIARKSWLLSTVDKTKISKQFADRALLLGFEDAVGFAEGVDGDFCSRWWYPVGGMYLPGGKIGRTLAKAGFFFDAQKDEQTVRSAAIGALQDNYHVPFLREYFARVAELAAKQRMAMGGRPSEFSVHMRERHEYDETTLAYVEKKYGLTKTDLEEFNMLLGKVKHLPVVISWPHLHQCLAIDSA